MKTKTNLSPNEFNFPDPPIIHLSNNPFIQDNFMNYGFAIDNRKCIGCHACTIICKSEHDIPIGVNRTYVKYSEKGIFPNTIREFSVHRCNHCENPPCTIICPTAALYKRPDGIVDFDRRRCIGCRSCMQACPYDALYVDPENKTAAKCNYCAHRINNGYEPACVVVCPVDAIISGDLNNKESDISRLISTNPVIVRKPEKNTIPNLYYIGRDSPLLSKEVNSIEPNYLWSEQSGGVGHFAGDNDSDDSSDDSTTFLRLLAHKSLDDNNVQIKAEAVEGVLQELETKTGLSRTVYDTPWKGVLWGWEVPAYIWTKAVAMGTYIVTFFLNLMNKPVSPVVEFQSLIITFIFLLITVILLIKDLDRPERFLYVMLRPQWSSWLVKGALIISIFGGIVGLQIAGQILQFPVNWLRIPGVLLAIPGSVYTAFLLAQAKGRDLWQSPLSSIQMLIHSILFGSIVLIIIDPETVAILHKVLLYGIVANLVFIIWEIFIPRRSADAQNAVKLMLKGYYSRLFYTGIIAGHILPLVLLQLWTEIPITVISGLLTAVGIYFTEFVRIRTPQLIALS